MKRVFRVQIRAAGSGHVSTIYVPGITASQVRAKLVRNGHTERNILSTTAIADYEAAAGDLGVVR